VLDCDRYDAHSRSVWNC